MSAKIIFDNNKNKAIEFNLDNCSDNMVFTFDYENNDILKMHMWKFFWNLKDTSTEMKFTKENLEQFIDILDKNKSIKNTRIDVYSGNNKSSLYVTRKNNDNIYITNREEYDYYEKGMHICELNPLEQQKLHKVLMSAYNKMI